MSPETAVTPDQHRLTPLFWGNVLLHGVFAIDLDKRLDYDRAPSADDDLHAGYDGADLDEFEVSAVTAEKLRGQ